MEESIATSAVRVGREGSINATTRMRPSIWLPAAERLALTGVTCDITQETVFPPAVVARSGERVT